MLKKILIVFTLTSILLSGCSIVSPSSMGLDTNSHNPIISIGPNGNWFVDGVDTGVSVQGPQGEKGDEGDPGQDGVDGKDGNSFFSTQSENYEFILSSNSSFSGQWSDEEMGDYKLLFKTDINSFKEIVIGKGFDEYDGMYLRLSSDNASIYNAYDNNLVSRYDLSITIKDYLFIGIFADMRNHAKIQIQSLNSCVEFETNWTARQGSIFVSSGDSTVLDRCKLSYYCSGWNKPVWLFGDSYFHCTSNKRWTSYLTEKNCDNYMLNGYAGRGSVAALNSLKHILNYSIPREIIWCLGMNNGDSGSINNQWKQTILELFNICQQNDINLVLSTVPNCPTIDNSFKNAFIRESGYRYIDFEKAVGSHLSASWYDGMLENGESPCHPTDLGALALFNEAITTCPELL